MTEWKEEKITEARWKYPSIFGDVDLCVGFIDKKNLRPQEKEMLLKDCVKEVIAIKQQHQDECNTERKKAPTEELGKEFDIYCKVESKKELAQKIRNYVDTRTEAIKSQELELEDPFSTKMTEEEFKEWCYSPMSHKRGEYKNDCEDSVVISSPLTSDKGEDYRRTEALRITGRTKKDKSKGTFHTSKSEKSEHSLIIIKANVQCKDCGWTTETEDLKTAKEFRRGENFCPKCNSTHFKMRNAFPYTIKYPYYSFEEEFRGELINTIFENVSWIDVVDCRKDNCLEPVFDGRFPLYPQTGDILYLENGKFKSIELKITILHPQPDSKVGGLCYRVLRSMPIKLIQLDLIRRGLMKLVILAEFVEDVGGLGISTVAQPREETVKDIQKIRDALGRDELTYAFIIMDKKNWDDYEFYFENLKEAKKKDKLGNVIELRKQVRFPKLWRDFTIPERRYRAKKSEVCLEITRKLFELE